MFNHYLFRPISVSCSLQGYNKTPRQIRDGRYGAGGDYVRRNYTNFPFSWGYDWVIKPAIVGDAVFFG